MAAPTKRCTQCWKFQPLEQFAGKRKASVSWCLTCRALYLSGGVRATRRNGISAPELRVLPFDSSGNVKLGAIPNTMTSGETCPEACGLRDGGCYGEFGVVAMHWRRVPGEGLTWSAFLEWVRWLPRGQLWRHNTVGDLPGIGDALDVDRLLQLVASNLGRRGFTMTRKPLRTREEQLAVEVANREGFTINATAHGLEDADRLVERLQGTGTPVVVVLPESAPDKLTTPAGRRVIICPEQTSGTTCSACQLCSHPLRTAIVGFRAHGQWSAKVDQLVQLRRPLRVAHGG